MQTIIEYILIFLLLKFHCHPEMSNNQESKKPVELHSDDEEYLPSPPALRPIELSLEHRQILYLQKVMGNIESILTEAQRKKYCVIFGERVLGEFNSLEEAKQAQNDQWKNVCTALYAPK